MRSYRAMAAVAGASILSACNTTAGVQETSVRMDSSQILLPKTVDDSSQMQRTAGNPTTTQEIPWCPSEQPKPPGCREPNSVQDYLSQQTMQQKQRTDRIVELTKPVFECVQKNAHAYQVYSVPERADIAARAAVGLCSKEEGAYRSALFQLAIVMTDFDASSRAQQTHEKLIESALTIIVGERQRRLSPPSQPAPTPPPSSRGI